MTWSIPECNSSRSVAGLTSCVDLMSETGMSNYQYTIALMIFLVAYGLFEVPSNGSHY